MNTVIGRQFIPIISLPQVILDWVISQLTSQSRVDRKSLANDKSVVKVSYPCYVTLQERLPRGLKLKSDLRRIYDLLGVAVDR